MNNKGKLRIMKFLLDSVIVEWVNYRYIENTEESYFSIFNP